MKPTFAYLLSLFVVNVWATVYDMEKIKNVDDALKIKYSLRRGVQSQSQGSFPGQRKARSAKSGCSKTIFFDPKFIIPYNKTGGIRLRDANVQPYRYSLKNRTRQKSQYKLTCFKICMFTAECIEWAEHDCRKFKDKNIPHHNTLKQCQMSKVFYNDGEKCVGKTPKEFAGKCIGKKIYFTLKECEKFSGFFESSTRKSVVTQATAKPTKMFSSDQSATSKFTGLPKEIDFNLQTRIRLQNGNGLTQFTNSALKDSDNENNEVKLKRPRKDVSQYEEVKEINGKETTYSRFKEEQDMTATEICFNKSFDGSRRLELFGGLMSGEKIRLNATILDLSRQFAFNVFTKKNHQVLHVAARQGNGNRNLVALNHKTMQNQWDGKEERVYDTKKQWFIKNKNFVIHIIPKNIGKSLWQFIVEYRGVNDPISIQLGDRRIVQLTETDSLGDTAYVEVYGRVRVFHVCYTPNKFRGRK